MVFESVVLSDSRADADELDEAELILSLLDEELSLFVTADDVCCSAVVSCVLFKLLLLLAPAEFVVVVLLTSAVVAVVLLFVEIF